ncbi:DEAD-box ATP-dependent RNA helicase 1 [Glycine max]|nr:DEAD-box ATP-dependent RNA helicase 1 [Glycine max]
MEEEKQQPSVVVLPWMRHPVDITRYQELPICSVPLMKRRLQSVLEKNMGISKLFPVQVTLCGKTLAYAFPIVQNLSTDTGGRLRALVVVPTRDLSLQVKRVFDALASLLGLRICLATDQSSLRHKLSSLIYLPGEDDGQDPGFLSSLWFQSKVDILVVTPGRLVDHVNKLSLKHLRYLMVDEADRLLREDYQSWLPTVLKLTQSRLTKIVLSATLTRDPGRLAQLNLHHPLFLSTGKMRYRLPEYLECYKLICERKVKPLYLVALLKSLGEENCIVFTRSVESTHHLCKLLNCFGDLKIGIKEFSSLKHQRVRRMEEEKQQPSVAVVPWMRHPVDITRCQELPVCSVPLMKRRLQSVLEENMGISKLFPVQVKLVFDAFASLLGLHICLATGQSLLRHELSSLIYLPGEDDGPNPGFLSPLWFQSKVDILVATPERLVDHVNKLSLKHLCYVVVDEADRFKPASTNIL